MDLREIAAIAMDEALEESAVEDGLGDAFKGVANKVKSVGVQAKNAVIGSDVKGEAAQAAKLSTKDPVTQMNDLAAHDKARHKGNFDPSTMTCTLRDKMAEALISMHGKDGINDQVKQQLGDKAMQAGQQAANKQYGKETDPELDAIRKLNAKRKELAGKDKNSEEYKAVAAELDKRRDDYLKAKIGEAECAAVEGLIQKAKLPQFTEKVKAWAAGVRDKIKTAKEQEAENPVSAAQEIALEKVEEKGLGEVDYGEEGLESSGSANEGVREMTPEEMSEGEKSQPVEEAEPEEKNDESAPVENPGEESGAADPEEGRPDTPVENPVNPDGESPEEQQEEPVQQEPPQEEEQVTPEEDPVVQKPKTREEMKNDVNSAWEAYDNLLKDYDGSDEMREEIDKAKASYLDAKKALADRANDSMMAQMDLREDYEQAKAGRVQAEKNLAELKAKQAAGDKVEKSELDAAEKAVEEAKQTEQTALENFQNYEEPVKQAPEQSAPVLPAYSHQSVGYRVDGDHAEYTINGKQYVDTSNMGFFEAIAAAAKAGWQGKEVVTAWDKMSGRWDQIKASDRSGSAESLRNLQEGVAGFQAKSGFQRILEDNVRNRKLSDRERLIATQALDMINEGNGTEKAAKFYNDQMAKLSKSEDAKAESKAKEALNSAKAQAASDKNRRDEEMHSIKKANETQKGRLALTKMGIVPENATEEERHIAEQNKQKLDDAVAKQAIDLEKKLGKQLEKPLAESNPAIIATMSKVAADMSRSGDPVLEARAAQIMDTIIPVLEQSTDADAAYQELGRFKRLLGVNDEAPGRGRGGNDGHVPTISVPGVDHAGGGVLTGSDTPSTATMDTSFLDRSTKQSNGSLAKQNDIVNKIVADFKTVTGGTLDPNDISIKPGISSTKMSINLGANKNYAQALVDEIESGMGSVAGTVDANGKAKLPVGVSFDKNTNTLTMTFQNDQKGNVKFTHIIDSPEWKKFKDDNKGRGTFSLGVKEDGKPDMHTLDDAVHLMIAGQTGSGKSVKMHTLMNSLFESNSPDDLRVIMVDPKGTEFSKYQGDPHLIDDPVTDMNAAAARFNWLVDENENRAKLFQQARVRTLADYNKLGAEGKLPPGLPKHLPRIAMVVDELADLMATNAKDVDTAITRLSAKARSQGINLVLATQRPDSKVITGNVKNNIPSTVGMSVKKQVDSQVVGIDGLEKLPSKGPYVAKIGNDEPVYGEGAFMSDDDIDGMVNASKKAYGGGKPPTTPPTTPPTQTPPKTPQNTPPTTQPKVPPTQPIKSAPIANQPQTKDKQASDDINAGFDAFGAGIKAASEERLNRTGRSVDFKNGGEGHKMFKSMHPDWVEIDNGDGTSHFQKPTENVGNSQTENPKQPASQQPTPKKVSEMSDADLDAEIEKLEGGSAGASGEGRIKELRSERERREFKAFTGKLTGDAKSDRKAFEDLFEGDPFSVAIRNMSENEISELSAIFKGASGTDDQDATKKIREITNRFDVDGNRKVSEANLSDMSDDDLEKEHTALSTDKTYHQEDARSRMSSIKQEQDRRVLDFAKKSNLNYVKSALNQLQRYQPGTPSYDRIMNRLRAAVGGAKKLGTVK